MNLADLSIRRPIFITCIILVMLAVGWVSFKKLGVDLFPDVTFPVVTVNTPYPGAGPEEIETLVTKPIEDELSTLAGVKRVTSVNQEGISTVIAEFTLETDVKYAEQQIRDRVGASKTKLPKDIKEPIIRRIDPADQPVLSLSLQANLPAAELFDLADDRIRPKLEQVALVGLVDVLGGRKREVQVQLDRKKLKDAGIPASQVAARLAASGENVPVGKVEEPTKETVLRTLGQFKSLDDIRRVIVNFFGNDVPVRVSDVGTVVDTLTDQKTRTFLNGNPSLFINVFRQSGANTLAVVSGLKKQIDKINAELATQPGAPKLVINRDSSVWIKANVDDVKESIIIGIILAILVVYLFLANGRSTIITGLALPNSLIGAFILMAAAGFTVNIMTLLALSLSVGLLIDDAIVVRENIFRHIEMGKTPGEAAREGTAEVRLAVIATTFTVIAVFGPVGFLKGVVGQFFKQFGLTICFAMLISLFDALTIAPMLSAYFAGRHQETKTGLWGRTAGQVLVVFNRFQDWLENRYEAVLRFTVAHPMKVLIGSFAVFFISMASVVKVPKTFLPQQDAGEFSISLDLPPGASLEAMTQAALKADAILRKNSEVEISALQVGSKDGNANEASFFVRLTPAKTRKLNTGQVKEKVREQFKEIAFANPKVKDFDAVAGGQRPFNLNIRGNDQKALEEYATRVFAWLKTHKGLKDVDVNFRAGKPEFQVVPDKSRMEQLGISTIQLGGELRTQIEGITPSKFRENGREYDVRVRLQDSQRDLRTGFAQTYVPNVNYSLVRLSDVAKPVETIGPSKINRQDRARFVQIAADIAPGGGMGNVMSDIRERFKEGDLKLPAGMSFGFVGQAENFEELGESMLMAMGFGVLFIFLVLASLYESFVTPFTIMLALPLALCGSFVGLFVARESLNIFSMIGTIMLLGVATKNSILLVDYANQLIREGVDRNQALIRAGKTRLRPILMTTFALIAGTLPVALGLNEASRQRTSMGVAIIGGLISSTVLTLLVVPAAFSYIERFRIWALRLAKRGMHMEEGSAKA
jgi:HAE1 family hydrophobic/amphiphilic exporter-1